MARDYKEEYRKESAKRRRQRSERNKARRLMFKKLAKKYGKAQAERMMKGKDVDHIKALNAGGKTVISNLRLRDPSKNSADKTY